MMQVTPHPLLIAPRNPAGDLPDSVKKGAGQYTFCIVRRLNDSVKSGAPSSHKKQRATAHKSIHLRHVFPYVGIIQIRFQVKTNQVYSQPIYLSSLFVKHYTKLKNNFQAFFNIFLYYFITIPFSCILEYSL